MWLYFDNRGSDTAAGPRESPSFQVTGHWNAVQPAASAALLFGYWNFRFGLDAFWNRCTGLLGSLFTQLLRFIRGRCNNLLICYVVTRITQKLSLIFDK